MKGTITQLCDLAAIPIPPELLAVEISPEQVQQEVGQLAMRYAAQTPVEIAQPSDILHCRAEAAYPDGRKILLYTGLNIPGTAPAIAAALGKQVGNTFSTQLAGTDVTLTVEAILRLTPATVDDSLISSLGMDGVTTLAAYTQRVTENLRKNAEMECRKEAGAYLMDAMLAGSTAEYDPAEFEAYLQAHMPEIEAAYQENEEEIPDMAEIRQAILYREKQNWVAQAFCQVRSIPLDRQAAEEEADQLADMMALMGEPVPNREELVEEALNNAAVMELFREIDNILAQKGAN